MINRNLLDADEYLRNFLRKKQLKFILICLFQAICSLIVSVCMQQFDSIVLFSIESLALTAIFFFELYSKQQIRLVTLRVIFVIYLFLIVLFPLACGFVIFPITIALISFFLCLGETYCGNNTLHWPYTLYLEYGAIFLSAALFTKFFFKIQIIENVDISKSFYYELLLVVNLAICSNSALTDLVDLRTVFLAKEYNDRLKETTDSLTGVFNRHYIKYLDMKKFNFVTYMDMDHFKMVNDTYGHKAGDKVLIDMAYRLSRHAEKELGVLLRMGGEEFVILTKNDPLEMIKSIMDDFRENDFVLDKQTSLHKTLSVGYTEVIGDLRQSIDIADKQAYTSKEWGRDRCNHNGKRVY